MARDTTARQRILNCLIERGPVSDSSGRAASVLKDAAGYPGSQLGLSQLLAAMERDGQIRREIRGKRTYRIWTDADPSSVRPLAGARPASEAEDEEVETGGELDYDELAQALLRRVARAALLERDGASAVTAGAQRRIRRLESRVTELERELARAQAERDKAAAERDEVQRQLDAAVNNVDVLTERLSTSASRPRSRARERLDSDERAILDQLTRRPAVDRSA